MQRRRAALSRLLRRQEHTLRTYHNILTFIMHRAAGYGGCFTPTMHNALCTWVVPRSKSRLCHKQTTPKVVCETETISSRRSQSVFFLFFLNLNQSSIAYSHQPKQSCTEEETAPESILTTHPNSCLALNS